MGRPSKTQINKGDKYFRLSILRHTKGGVNGRYVDAICECGLVKEYLFQNILQGRTRSCGCFNLEKTKETISY